MHIYIMTKIISVSDEAYERLKRMKGKESFSKAILGLTEPRKRRTFYEIMEAWSPDEGFAKSVEEASAQVRKMKFRRAEL